MTARDIAKVKFEGVKSIEPNAGHNIIAIAVPPRSRKSTIAEIVTDVMNENSMKTTLVPTDGFHLDNETLKSINLLDRKGALETFDVKDLTELIKNCV